MRLLGIGMVGHGFMGKVHGHACRSLRFHYDPPPADVRLAGVATAHEATWRSAVEEWGYAFGTCDFRELCARDDIDIIDCCVPNALHRDVIVAAIEAGKHVYADKPLACTMAEARDIVACAKAHPEVISQMTFQYRFIPAMLRARQLVEEGRLGDIFTVRIAYLHAGYIDPNRPMSWRLDPEVSGAGGALFDLGVHVIDLARYLLGDIAAVRDCAETFICERPVRGGGRAPVKVDDVSILSIRLANGGVGVIESSRLATGAQDEIRVEVHGSRGAIRFNMMQPNYLEFYDVSDPEGPYGGLRGYKALECVGRYPAPASLPGPKSTIGWERFHVHCMHNFIRHIVEGTPAQPDLLEGARAQAVLDAAIRSRASGVWEQVEAV